MESEVFSYFFYREPIHESTAFSTLIFSLFGSPFAVAAEVDAHEVEEIVVIGSKQSKLQGNEHQNLAERMSLRSRRAISLRASSTIRLPMSSRRTGRSSGRLIAIKVTRRTPCDLRGRESVGLLKLLGGTAGSTVGAIGAVYLLFLTGVWEFCDDNSPEDCGEVTGRKRLQPELLLVSILPV